MIFGVAEIVWWCSQYFIMEPGDIIVTGTPSGVALGMKPPKFLKVGDVVELGMRRARHAEAEGRQGARLIERLRFAKDKSPGPWPGAFSFALRFGRSAQ